jgi:uncharacterized damage-inducible protein DinB
MSQESTALATFYAGWKKYQDALAQAIAPLTPEQLALRAAPHQWSIGILAAHIVSARAWWFHDIVGEGGDDVGAMTGWDDEVPFRRTAAELVAAFHTTWQFMQDTIARWSPAELAAENVRRTRPNGQTVMYSRQWIIYHLLEHDIHHGGEISQTLGTHGLAAPDL